MASRNAIQERLGEALACQQAGDVAQAEMKYRAILRQAPDCSQAWHLLGTLAHQLGNQVSARAFIQYAIHLEPFQAAYFGSLAEVWKVLDCIDAAVDTLHQALELAPNSAELRGNLANLLYEQDLFPEARSEAQRALSLEPRNSRIWNILGNIHEAEGHHLEARAAYRQALEDSAIESGTRARYLGHLALSLDRAGHLEEASETYEKALGLDPQLAEAHWNFAILRLRMGDFPRGWREYEWRWHLPHFPSPHREFPQPLWCGESLLGKSLLVHAEQGFGDLLQMVRFIPRLARMGARVLLECPPELVRLLDGLEGLEALLSRPGPLPLTDYHLPSMSLPHRLGLTCEDLPGPTQYLRVLPSLKALWQRPQPSAGFHVGVVWAGSLTPRGFNANRSLSLKALAPLADLPGVHLHSLQKGAGEEAMSTVDFPIHNDMERVRDFADLAACMTHLDLILTVDTAAAHLAGALGLPAWVMLPEPAAYQWQVDREDSPWYPSLRLFRQERPGDWASVVETILPLLRRKAEDSALAQAATPFSFR